MGKKASLSVTQKAQVVALSKMKLCERHIAKTCKENKTAVHNAIKKFENKRNFCGKEKNRTSQDFQQQREAPNEGGSYSLFHDFCVCIFFLTCCKKT